MRQAEEDVARVGVTVGRVAANVPVGSSGKLVAKWTLRHDEVRATLGSEAAVAALERPDCCDATISVVLRDEGLALRLQLGGAHELPAVTRRALVVINGELDGVRHELLEEHARVVICGAGRLLAEDLSLGQGRDAVEKIMALRVAARRVAADTTLDRAWKLVAIRRARDSEFVAAAQRDAAIAALEILDDGQSALVVVVRHKLVVPLGHLRQARRLPSVTGVLFEVVQAPDQALVRASALRARRRRPIPDARVVVSHARGALGERLRQCQRRHTVEAVRVLAVARRLRAAHGTAQVGWELELVRRGADDKLVAALHGDAAVARDKLLDARDATLVVLRHKRGLVRLDVAGGGRRPAAAWVDGVVVQPPLERRSRVGQHGQHGQRDQC